MGGFEYSAIEVEKGPEMIDELPKAIASAANSGFAMVGIVDNKNSVVLALMRAIDPREQKEKIAKGAMGPGGRPIIVG